ncbi:MAG TPA: TRAFs-binding domain-containing protein [Polyangiaceae bacterium]|nr:TRAFs-binding domain-containing protein [Polyangiaceae bacterium]
MNKLCFVLMPFGKKADASGRAIDFDAVYREVIAPAIEDAGLDPLRADEERQGGIIHKTMFERLILCEYAVADLTLANANVFYELGVRHAVRPWRTVSLFADGTRLPFDVNYLRAQPYALSAAGTPSSAAADREQVAESLRNARAEAANPSVDSPVFQLVDYLPSPNLDHQKTDLFRDQVRYSEQAKKAFAQARKEKSAASVAKVLASLHPIAELESGVLVDAMLSFRAVEGWSDMIAFIEQMPRPLRQAVMVREQLAFALNRAGRGDEAEEVLLALLKERGSAPETLGILGRVYKDRWEAALKAGEQHEARALLTKAVDTYLRGFEADFRDAYPGINALTLMVVRSADDPRVARLEPIVRYAVERKIAITPTADYWDQASLVELAVLRSDAAGIEETLGHALAAVREVWEPKTTARNLSLIRKAREKRGEQCVAADDAERRLRVKAGLSAQLD